MKDLRFSLAAIAALLAFSLYLTGMSEAEDPIAIATASLLPILGGLFLASGTD